MARMTRADATRHARPHGRATRAHAARKCAQVARTRVRGHADARVAPRGRGARIWRAHGLVGPG